MDFIAGLQNNLSFEFRRALCGFNVRLNCCEA
jgi:hypothetical protein